MTWDPSHDPFSLGEPHVCCYSPPWRLPFSYSDFPLCFLYMSPRPLYISDEDLELKMRRREPGARLLEARVGLNFQQGRGLSIDPRAKAIPETNRLLRYLHKIKLHYVAYKSKWIPGSRGIRKLSDAILKRLGSAVWPDVDQTPESYHSWLLNPSEAIGSEHNSWVAAYPKRLSYSDPSDREM